MGYLIEINSLLRIPATAGIDLGKIRVGEKYRLEKRGKKAIPSKYPD